MLEPTSGHCPSSYDTVLCWLPQSVGSLAMHQCFAEFNGVIYDNIGKCSNMLRTVRGHCAVRGLLMPWGAGQHSPFQLVLLPVKLIGKTAKSSESNLNQIWCTGKSL